jgi:hypothetical protein
VAVVSAIFGVADVYAATLALTKEVCVCVLGYMCVYMYTCFLCLYLYDNTHNFTYMNVHLCIICIYTFIHIFVYIFMYIHVSYR